MRFIPAGTRLTKRGEIVRDILGALACVIAFIAMSSVFVAYCTWKVND